MKLWGSKTTTPEEILSEWEAGNVFIEKKGGGTPDYRTITSLLTSCKPPDIRALRKTNFNSAISSPNRPNRN